MTLVDDPYIMCDFCQAKLREDELAFSSRPPMAGQAIIVSTKDGADKPIKNQRYDACFDCFAQATSAIANLIKDGE